jgi:hypothetical protein
VVFTWRHPAPHVGAADWGPLCPSRCLAQAPHGALSLASGLSAAEGLSYMQAAGMPLPVHRLMPPAASDEQNASPSKSLDDRSNLGVDCTACC